MLRRAQIILIFLLFLVVSTLAEAKLKDEDWNPLVEGYVAHEAGNFKFENKVDEGSYDTVGVGLRGGYNFPYLFVGGEAYYALPSFGGHKSLTTSTRESYPLADNYSLNYGGTLILKLGPLHVVGTVYFKSKLNGTIENSDPFGADGDYNYHGFGSRLALDVRIYKGLSIGAGVFHYSYDKYSLDRDVKTLSPANKADRPALDLDGVSFTINYNLPITIGK